MPTQRQLFLRHLAQTSPKPLGLSIERAMGCYMYDTSGKPYLDLIAGIGVSALGHRHPAVTAAVKAQLDSYWHTLVYGEMILTPQVKLGHLLAQQLPDGLDNVYLVNSGSEAIEGGIKLAKKYTGRAEIVACQNAYHGSTQAAASLMKPAYFSRAFFPGLPGVRHMQYNLWEDLDTITERTACVVMETVQAESGVHPPAEGYLQAVRNRCDEVGALLMLDEVQAGYGRCGSLFAFEQYGIVPDILALAKGMGGGMPIGAFVSSRSMMQTFMQDPVLGHITTFGGHPVCSAAAHATLQTLVNEEKIIGEVNEKSDLFVSLLKHPAIVQIRRAGLLMAVELADAHCVQQVIHKSVQNGLITDWFLFNDKSLRIAPPLTITTSEIEKACSILRQSMDLLD